MVRLILNGAGRVVDFDYDVPEGEYTDRREECPRCGELFDPEYSGNYAGVCKGCWKELNAAMRQALTKALNDFSPDELKLMDEWGDIADLFLECVDARIKGSTPKRKNSR